MASSFSTLSEVQLLAFSYFKKVGSRLAFNPWLRTFVDTPFRLQLEKLLPTTSDRSPFWQGTTITRMLYPYTVQSRDKYDLYGKLHYVSVEYVLIRIDYVSSAYISSWLVHFLYRTTTTSSVLFVLTVTMTYARFHPISPYRYLHFRRHQTSERSNNERCVVPTQTHTYITYVLVRASIVNIKYRQYYIEKLKYPYFTNLYPLVNGPESLSPDPRGTLLCKKKKKKCTLLNYNGSKEGRA